MIIKRYLSEKSLERMKKDFRFLIKTTKGSLGELEIALRNNYFNVYYKGNSLAKVIFKPNGLYEVLIHRQFVRGTEIEQDERFNSASSNKENNGRYASIRIDSKLLHPLLQKKHINQLMSNISRGYNGETAFNKGEEATVEQMIITDNLNREDLIIIDRQITDRNLKLRKADLLALKQVDGNKYKILVIEVKLGKNPELKEKVENQIKVYVDHINKYIDDYQFCYQENYRQKKELGLLDKPEYETIEIIPEVSGMIVVAGYSGIAEQQIKNLINNNPSLIVQTLPYRLDARLV